MANDQYIPYTKNISEIDTLSHTTITLAWKFPRPHLHCNYFRIWKQHYLTRSCTNSCCWKSGNIIVAILYICNIYIHPHLTGKLDSDWMDKRQNVPKCNSRSRKPAASSGVPQVDQHLLQRQQMSIIFFMNYGDRDCYYTLSCLFLHMLFENSWCWQLDTI